MPHLNETAKGVYVIAATPFTDSGAVDVASIDRMVDSYIACGVQGMTILGMMGEAEGVAVEEHLIGCPDCARLAEYVRSELQLMTATFMTPKRAWPPPNLSCGWTTRRSAFELSGAARSPRVPGKPMATPSYPAPPFTIGWARFSCVQVCQDH